MRNDLELPVESVWQTASDAVFSEVDNRDA